MHGVALIMPPGWTLHPGGPHIALPLLKGFLEQQHIPTKVYDLNIGSTRYHQIHIAEDDCVHACQQFTASAMNQVYFRAEDQLQALAKKHHGVWYAHEGYRRDACNIASAKDIRHFSKQQTPFTRYYLEVAIPAILAQQPMLIGISVTVPTQILQVFELIRLLRESGFVGCIVIGGNVVTRIYKDLAESWVFDLLDGVIQLQGERALLAIYECLKSKRDFSAVPNLLWRDQQGTLQFNQAALLSPVDFAPPDFSDMPLQDYWGTNYLTMVAGRGCYYGKCSFCAIPFGYGKKGFIGSATAYNVARWMKNNIEQFNISRFKFIDEALHPRMMRDLAYVLEKESIHCEFEAYLRFESTWLKPELLELAARAGLRKVYLGLELVPSDERDLLTKSDNADPLLLLQRLHALGIKSHVFCMFGFPGTGMKEAFDTIEFALKHAQLIDTLDIFPFYYARHTKVDGVRVIDTFDETWNVEHRYLPAAQDTLHPSKVNILAERLSNVVWREHPHWFHPVYRMFSPWHDNTLAAIKRCSNYA